MSNKWVLTTVAFVWFRVLCENVWQKIVLCFQTIFSRAAASSFHLGIEQITEKGINYSTLFLKLLPKSQFDTNLKKLTDASMHI
jgi:hypothetical protein